MRIAISKSAMPGQAQSSSAAASPGRASFLDILSSTFGQPGNSSNGIGMAASGAADEAGAANAAAAAGDARAAAETSSNPQKAQIAPAAGGRGAAPPLALSTPAQSRPGKSEENPAPVREAKTQPSSAAPASVAPAATPAAVASAANSSLPVVAPAPPAQPEEKSPSLQSVDRSTGEPIGAGGDAAVQSSGASADAAAAQDEQQAAGANLAAVPPGRLAQPEEQSPASVAPAGKSAGKPTAESSGSQSAGASAAGDSAEAVEAGSAPACATDAVAGFALGGAGSAAAMAIGGMFPLAPVAGSGDGLLPAGAAAAGGAAAAAGKSTGAAQSSSANAESAGNTKDKASAAGGETSGAAAQGTASGNQAALRADGNGSQPVSDPSKQVAPQGQAIAAPGPQHAAAPAHAESAAQAARSADRPALPQTPDPAASVVNTASLVQKMSESEMRVNVHSSEFGAIEIRTSLSQQQMMAQISVDHGDLGRALSAHIPAMEAKLGSDLGVRALVQVSQSATSFAGGGGNSPQREQQGWRVTPIESESAPGPVEIDVPGLYGIAGTAGGYRLDIQA